MPCHHKLSLYLSIVPSWNWNPNRRLPSDVPLHYQSYHRGIEICMQTMQKIREEVYQSYHRGIEMANKKLAGLAGGLSIVPSWNWNDRNVNGQTTWFDYQSYHRGIEIEKLSNLEYIHPTINRTIVELKWVNLKPPLSQLNLYQSYHRGIEITTCLAPVHWAATINRTIVELKSRNFCLLHGRFVLSIVPSWNWNK